MRLDRALPILTDGARDAPARQQTLRATIDWSHELLSLEARKLLRRLAVFRGSFTLEAAETVGDADLDTLGELVDESLRKSVGANRFLLLETIREYALERLRDAGEEEELVRRHGGFYLERMQAIEPLMRGHRMDECLRWYDAEAQNIRAALDGLLAVGEAEHAFTLADITSFFWISRVNTREGASWLEHALSVASEPTRARGRAMTRLADMFVRLGRPIDSEQLLREAVEIAERTDDSRGLATAFRLLGTAASDRGDRVAALEHARNARRVAMQTDDPLLRAIVTADLGILLNRTEDGAEEGQELLHEVLAFRRQIGDRPNEGGILFALGERKLTDGEFDAAKPYLLEVAEIGRELGGELLAVGFVGLALHALLTDARGDALEYAREALQVVSGLDSPLVNLGVAEVAAIVGRTMHPGLAVRVLGAGFGIRERHGREIDPVQEKLYGPFVAELREQLGDDEYEREHTAGAAMTLDEALALAETILS
jgi:tetratricopeptide (TPR) repeat protein